MCEGAFQFEASQAKFAGTGFNRRFEVANKFHMFRKLSKNLAKELSLRKRVVMLKTTIRIDTNRVISAIVDRHYTVGPAV
jgi:hypothetical protein